MGEVEKNTKKTSTFFGDSERKMPKKNKHIFGGLREKNAKIKQIEREKTVKGKETHNKWIKCDPYFFFFFLIRLEIRLFGRY